MAEDSKTTYDGVRVLIIEDQVHTRTMLKGMLRQIGISSAMEASEGMDGSSGELVIPQHALLN